VDWYTQRMTDHVHEATSLVMEDSIDIVQDSDVPYVIGPEDLLQNFRGYDIELGISTISEVGTYPDVQATRDGWMYLWNQAFPLFWSYRHSKSDMF
jgi:hypothetical protein